jgi:hypothetical protein
MSKFSPPYILTTPSPKSDFFCSYFPGFAGLGIWGLLKWKEKMPYAEASFGSR